MNGKILRFALAAVLSFALCTGCGGGSSGDAGGGSGGGTGGGSGGGTGGSGQVGPQAAVPAPFDVMAAAIGSDRIMVVWDKEVNGDPPGGFVVLKKERGAASWTEVAAVNANTLHYLEENASPGDWSYQIGAVDGQGLVRYSPVLDFTLPVDPYPARATRLKGYSNGQGSVYLHWQDNSSNETGFLICEAGMTGYGYPTGVYTVIAQAPANATEFTLTGLEPSSKHNIVVKSVNGEVESEVSNLLTVVVRATPNFVEYKTMSPTNTNHWQYVYDERGVLSAVNKEVNTSGIFLPYQTFGGEWGSLTGVYTQGVTFTPVTSTETSYGEPLTRSYNGNPVYECQYNESGDLVTKRVFNTYASDAWPKWNVPGEWSYEWNQFGLPVQEYSYSYDNTLCESDFIYDDRLRVVGGEERTVDLTTDAVTGVTTSYQFGANRLTTRSGAQGADAHTALYEAPGADGFKFVAYVYSDVFHAHTGKEFATYNAAHAPVLYSKDANLDGKPEKRERYFYYQSGAIYSYVLEEDDYSDGKYNFRHEERYLEDGSVFYTETYSESGGL